MIHMIARILVILGVTFTLTACQEDENRQVISAQTPEGRAFYFMPIDEECVTDFTIAVSWPTNWAYDTGRNPFVPMIAAHTLSSGGTDKLEPQDVMELFNDKNSQALLYTTVDHVLGEVSFPNNHRKEIIDVVRPMLATPNFDPKWMERIKQGTRSSLEQARAQTDVRMWDAARTYVLGDHPVNNTLTPANLDLIENINVQDLQEWHRTVLVQNDVTVVVTGAISRKDAGRTVDELLGDLPMGVSVTRPDVPTMFDHNMIYFQMPDAEKTILGFIGALPDVFDGNELTDLLALQIFADTTNGPLHQAIRNELRATYGFQAGFTDYNVNTRILFMFGEVEAEKLDQARATVTKVYAEFCSDPDLSNLTELRTNLAHGTAKNVSYVGVAARSIMGLANANQDVTFVPTLGDKIERITAQDVAERLKTSFPAADELIVFAAGPDHTALPGACVITSVQDIEKCR